MRFNIKPGNTKRYNAAFHDDTCIECQTDILEGDPIGYIDGDGPYCDDCLKDCGTKTLIETRYG